jgi:hypothetical protein
MGGPPDNAVFEYDWSLLEPETNRFLPHAGFFYLPTKENLVNEATTRLQKAGFKNPPEAAKHFNLPDQKAIVFPHQLLFEHPTTIPRVVRVISIIEGVICGLFEGVGLVKRCAEGEWEGRFFKAWEGSENRIRGESRGSAWPPRLWQTTFSSPSSSYPSAGCSSAEPASVSLENPECFPFPLPRGSIGRETGNACLS